MPDIGTIAEIDLTVLEDLDLDTKPKCEAQGCDRDASLMIHCPICQQGPTPTGEFSCTECYTMLMFINSDIMFEKDKSCDHIVPIRDCAITPL